jgi:choline dehydrogenase-like flavoprotein
MLTPRQQSVLIALCRTIVPLPAEPDPGAVRLARLLEVRLRELPPRDARRLARLLALMDGRAAGLLWGGVPRGFATLPEPARVRWLRAWETSRLPALRSAFQALRRLVLATAYADPRTHAELGFPGPLLGRAPRRGVEGPLPRTASPGPVAREGEGETGRVTSILPQLDLLADPALSSIVEGARLRGDTRVSADVCVIGTGPGGAVVAARLVEAGYDVVLLEEGAYWRPERFTQREAETMRALYADGGARATEDLSIPLLQGRGVGGGSLVNWLVMLRTPPAVLDEWAVEHGTEGMLPHDLHPHFVRIEEETGAGTVPDEAHSPANRALLDGAAVLGWSASSLAVNARGCLRCGGCGLGCAHGARRGAAEVYLPAALAGGARIFADARAERIEAVERGGRSPLRRVHATVLDRESGVARGRLVVEAPVVVLAAGAVGTPALLQRSGLGGGGVGRWLRLHPTTAVSGVYDREMHPGAGIPLSAICDEFASGSDGYGFWIETYPFQPGLSAAATPGFGAPHREAMLRQRESAGFIVLVRDGAERERSSGEVRLGADGRPRIRYRLSGVDRGRLLRGVEAAARIHFAAGASEVATLHAELCRMRSPAELGALARRAAGPNQLGVLSAHLNGTCRLGTDPRTSGCTPDGERHGAPGIYVADGSLLPTAPGVNPQETIMALASAVAERVAARHPAGRAGSAGALASR